MIAKFSRGLFGPMINREQRGFTMTKNVVRCVFAFLLAIGGAESHFYVCADNAQDKKARAERETKALALVDQIMQETDSLTLPENRVRIHIALADALWQRDAKRAVMLFRKAAASFVEIAAAVTTTERDYQERSQQTVQLRQEMLQVATKHDPGLALEFLRATRPASSASQLGFEAQLEMRLAVESAAKSPAQALAIGEDALKLGIDYNAISLIYGLQAQDKQAAERFFQSLLKRLRSDFTRSPAAPSVALVLLRAWADNTSGSPERNVSEISLTGLNETVARELCTLLFTSLDPTRTVDSMQIYYGRNPGVVEQLKPLLPDIERLSPALAATLRRQISEQEKLNQQQRGPWAKYDELFRTGDGEALLEAAKTAPPEIADRLRQQAAWKVMGDEDSERASRIIAEIADPGQRMNLTANLDRHLFERAREQKKLTEARELLSKLAPEERAVLLAQLASSCATDGDRPTALSVLGEAEAIAGGRAMNYSQLGAQLQIATAYQQLDVSKSTSLVEGVIARVNELSAAAQELSGFDLQAQYFSKNEFIINISTPMGNVIQQSARLLSTNAMSDFDRARMAAERFDRLEMRLMTLVEIAKAMLTEEPR
jgi:hypothetical protein